MSMTFTLNRMYNFTQCSTAGVLKVIILSCLLAIIYKRSLAATIKHLLQLYWINDWIIEKLNIYVLCMCECVCVCVCVCICVCARACVHVCAYLYIHTHNNRYVHIKWNLFFWSVCCVLTAITICSLQALLTPFKLYLYCVLLVSVLKEQPML